MKIADFLFFPENQRIVCIPRRKPRYWLDAAFGRVVGQDRWRLWKAHLHIFLFRNLGLGTARSDVVFSLTSYHKRQDVLCKTVLSLCGQNIQPRMIFLTITESDWQFFSDKNQAFLEEKCSVNLVKPDLRSYKKLFYALTRFPEHRIVTFDDDIYYEFDLVSQLLRSEQLGDSVICKRAHVIRVESGVVLPYGEWDFEVKGDYFSELVFPTSGGGMMILPQSLDDEVLKTEIFLEKAKSADDMWWYFMLRRNGGKARKCGGEMRLYEWDRNDTSGLYVENLAGANDKVFKSLQEQYSLLFES